MTDWFEPFYRPNEAHSLGIGGNGLGLSIVAALARANGWRVELSSHGDGVKVQIWFGLSL